jgi:hypothetical protein
MRPESKFWHEVKQNIKEISFTRLETWASAGVPDLLCYNKNGKFFTIELKVSKGSFPILSPHQISFHVRHPMNTFILVKALGPCTVKLYEGSKIMELYNHEPCTCVAESWPKIQEFLDQIN